MWQCFEDLGTFLFPVDANKHDLEKKKQVTQNVVKACGA
jgi:hypothetical protein